jgi:hypothetical protein
MKWKHLGWIGGLAALSVFTLTPGSRADIFNPAWESPVEGVPPNSPISGLQAFRGHVSSTTGATVTVRLLIPAFSISLQLPWGTDRADVAASGPDRFSGFGDVLNVGNLPPGPVTMTIEMREGGGSGACNPPACVSITRTFTAVKPGARTGEVDQFRFTNDFAMFANLTNPAIPSAAALPSNLGLDLSTGSLSGGPDLIIAPVTIQDSASGGGGFRTATLRQRWIQNTQSMEIVGAATSDSSFAAVQAILGAKCAVVGCHVGGGTALPGALVLNTSTNSFFNTVARRSLESPQLLLVTPGDLTNSYLYQKVIDGGVIAPGTTRMPQGCSGASCLSAAEINTLGTWILNGAPPPIP